MYGLTLLYLRFTVMETFDFILPSLVLAPFVKHYWILNTDEPDVSERVTPIGCLQLVFHRGDRMYSETEGELQPHCFIGGQSAGFTDLRATGKVNMLVVVFHPHGTRAFFRMPANEFQGRNVAIEDLNDLLLQDLRNRIWDTKDNAEAVRLIEQFLISRLRDIDAYNNRRIATVMAAIDRNHQSSIAALSDIACLSHKQFSRIFAEYVGTTPKEFTRIVRYQRALYLLQDNPLLDQTELAIECGFYDQPHLIKEFKTFSGYTPNEYMAICQPYSDYFTPL